MDETGATTNGDGHLKRDRKNFSDGKDHLDDKNSSNGANDQWAKASISSCSSNIATHSDTCAETKLPAVELIIHDPGAAATRESSSKLASSGDGAKGGEAVLKRLAATAESSSNPFETAQYVSLRADGIVDKNGVRVSNETLKIVPSGQVVISGPDPLAQTTKGALTEISPLTIPVIQASQLVIKESPTVTSVPAVAAGTSERIIPAAAAGTSERTIPATAIVEQTKIAGAVPNPALVQANPFQSATQVSLRTDGVAEAGKKVSAEPLVIQTPGQFSQPAKNGTNTEISNPLATPVIQASQLVIKESPTVTSVPAVAAGTSERAIPASATFEETKIAAAVTNPALVQANPFQSATQVSLRTDGVAEAGKKVSAEPLVIQTPGQFSQPAKNGTNTEISNPLATPVIQASQLVIKESPTVTSVPSAAAGTSERSIPASATFEQTKMAAAVTNPALVQANPFQSATQVSLRTDGVAEAGKKVSAEPLVIQTPGQFSQPAKNGTNTEISNPLAAPVIQASQLVIKDSPTVTSVPGAAAGTSERAIPAGATFEQTKMAAAVTNPALVQANPFQSATQVSLRPDGVAEAGKKVSSEPLVIQSPGQFSQPAKNGTNTEISNPLATPVIQASQLVIKDSPAVTALPAAAVGTSERIIAAGAAGTSEKATPASATVEQTKMAAAVPNPEHKSLTAPIPAVGQIAKETGGTLSEHKIGPANFVQPFQIAQTVSAVQHIKGTDSPNKNTLSLLDKFAQTTFESNGPSSAAGKNVQNIVDKLSTAAGANGPRSVDAGVVTSASATVGGNIFQNSDGKIAASSNASSNADSNAVAGSKIEIGKDKGESGVTKTTKNQGENQTVSTDLVVPLKDKKKDEKDKKEESEDGEVAVVKSKRSGSGGGSAAGAAIAIQPLPQDPSTIGLSVTSMPLAPVILPPLEIIGEGKRSDVTNGQAEGEVPGKNDREQERRPPTRREFEEAVQMLAEKRRLRQTAKKQTPAKPARPVNKPKQRRCLIRKGDTLESIAFQYLGDKDLAELIYEINKGFWREKKQADEICLQLIYGSTIFLPTPEEIQAYRLTRGKSGRTPQKFAYEMPTALRSLRQAVSHIAPESEDNEEQTVIVVTKPIIYTACAQVTSTDIMLQTAQRLSAPLSDASRILKPGQAQELSQLDVNSRITVDGDWSAQNDSICSARIEVVCDGRWVSVMEYCIDGEASLKVYSLSGKVQNIPLDLPALIIKDMALRDLENNRLAYSKKYLLGRKIFC
jgi:hypothetical protein